MNRIRFYIIFGVLPYFFCACKKYVTVEPPEDQVQQQQVFTSDSKATSAVTAVYGNMINGSPSFANFLTTMYAGMSSDELNRYNPTLVFQEFLNNQLVATNSQVKNIWTSAYKTIYYTNANIEGLEASGSISAGVKKQLIAESKFTRAFCYFYLVNLFGDVPLANTTDYAQNAALPRETSSRIYQFIATDLEGAKTDLEPVYPGGEKARPNRWAASALLSRVYLYLQDWKKAEALASEVIGSGLFTPLPELRLTFLKNSREAIWQLAPTSGVLQEARQMRPAGSTPQVYLTQGLLKAFETGDGRRKQWVDSLAVQSVLYFYPGKYKNTTTAVTEYYMVLRVAEQYLIRAEARAHQNKASEGVDDVNLLRRRAGLADLPSTLSPEALLTAIEKERRVELFAEWAHRWFDLKRTQRATDVLSPLKSGWQATDQLYPIPEEELLLNIHLTQNPGY